LYPEVQEKLYNEIKERVGDGLLQFADISEMVYAFCIMYETLRLFPPIGTIGSKAIENELLLDTLIPKNTTIGPDFVGLHRNKKYWGGNCDEFDPSRFDNRGQNENDWHPIMNGKMKIPAKGAFMAFGEGATVCLGEFS
jgi:cytochrome P450